MSTETTEQDDKVETTLQVHLSEWPDSGEMSLRQLVLGGGHPAILLEPTSDAPDDGAQHLDLHLSAISLENAAALLRLAAESCEQAEALDKAEELTDAEAVRSAD